MESRPTLTALCEWTWANIVINGYANHNVYESMIANIALAYDAYADDVYAAMNAASAAVHGPLR